MGIHRGPNPVNDGLVFGCDTGYGIADNDTATRFYPGEPTENILALGGSDTEMERSGTSYPYYSINIDSYIQSRWSSSNNVLTLSYEGKRDYVAGGTGGGNDGYPVYYIYFSDWSWAATLGTGAYDWQYVKKTFTMPDPTTKSVRFAIYHMNSGNRGRSYSRKHMLTFGDHAVPFVDGTRSATASLIDLKRATNIDVSNVSFDSTGQPTFDNTDDRITMPNSSVFNHTSELSIEAWVKFDGNNSDFIFEKGNVNTQYSLFSHGTDIVFRTYHASDSGHQTLAPSKTTAGIINGQWHHIVGSWDGSTKRIYVDGVDKASVSKSGALTTTSNGAAIGSFGGTSSGYYFGGDIAIVKIYDKGLSAAEVKQNYNSQKNRFDI